jgi:hypothetical protein
MITIALVEYLVYTNKDMNFSMTAISMPEKM